MMNIPWRGLFLRVTTRKSLGTFHFERMEFYSVICAFKF